MAESVTEFLAGREIRKEALKTYQKLPEFNSPEGQQYLYDLSDKVAREIGILIETNACLGCGRSLLASDSTCEHCGNMNDVYFDAISVEIDKHPIGRVISTRCH